MDDEDEDEEGRSMMEAENTLPMRVENSMVYEDTQADWRKQNVVVGKLMNLEDLVPQQRRY